ELEEHVRALNRDLFTLEKGKEGQERAELVKTLFRTAHSLKGASGSVNVTLIGNVCHRLEEMLAGVRDGSLALNPERFQLLFAVADAIQDAGVRLRNNEALSGSPLAALLPKLGDSLPSLATSASRTEPMVQTSSGTSVPLTT